MGATAWGVGIRGQLRDLPTCSRRSRYFQGKDRVTHSLSLSSLDRARPHPSLSL